MYMLCLLFTFAIFSSSCDIKLTFEVTLFSGRSRNFENGCKDARMTYLAISNLNFPNKPINISVFSKPVLRFS
jgi:hypothetical protein